MQKLTHVGAPEGNELIVHRPPRDKQQIAAHSVEISVATAGPMLGIGWLERDRSRVRSFATLGDLDTMVFRQEAMDLGPTELGRVGKRGHVAVDASSDGELVVLRRGSVVPCTEQSDQPCTGFDFFRLRPEGAAKRGLPLAVPEPCDVGIAAFSSTPGRRHYGVCTRKAGKRTTTVFSIQTDPEYAQANDVLPGCGPRGSVVLGDVTFVSADCARGRRAVRIVGGGAPSVSHDFSGAELSCDGDRPRLEWPHDPALSYRLSKPAPRLAGVLPEKMAPGASRAVWTGSALLVLVPTGDGVSLRRYQCVAGAMVLADLS